MKADKELYRELRGLPCDQLWSVEVARFNRAPPQERMERVAVIRAVGVVFAGQGTKAQRIEVRAWLRGLLQDPAEKIRRYAMAALPKIGAGEGEEKELLSLLQATTVEREKKYLGRALDKIGGAATLDVMKAAPGLLPQTEQKVRASMARKEQPSAIRMDRVFPLSPDLRIHLRCRRGLEGIVRDEVQDFIAKRGKFKLMAVHAGVVTLTPTAPFSLADLYTMRCFATLGFVLGTARPAEGTAVVEGLASVIASPLSRKLLTTFTEGSLRYRLDFIGKGHQRGAVRDVVNRAFALCPEILNDARGASWAMDVFTIAGGQAVELRPKFVPDPRLGYRTDDVDAASHPPLAACMARLAGRVRDEVVWDPFCGSGLELIESALLGGVKKIFGTDISPEAIAIVQANVAAAKLKDVQAKLVCCDFRDHAKIAGLGPSSVTLIISNPPLGRRVRVPDLRGLFADLFTVAAQVLKPGGRLVFANPMRLEPDDPSLKLQYREVVDLGGFDCRLELYEKQVLPALRPVPVAPSAPLGHRSAPAGRGVHGHPFSGGRGSG
ncbi:MAG: methyltransferase domain-containing protein [Kiritimatiellaeota bacterium]|nr:methyltransferase domain-containing protein [Kiritimatiellota bacterium]